MISKVGDRSRGRPEGSLFNSYYTEVWGRALLQSLDYSTLPLIDTLYCWVLSKEASSTIFKVFGMTRPGIEPRFPGPLANTLPTRPRSCRCIILKVICCKTGYITRPKIRYNIHWILRYVIYFIRCHYTLDNTLHNRLPVTTNNMFHCTLDIC